jgi:methionyl-tRNA formyltransferase
MSHRIVFFGLDGSFSAITLKALAASGLVPSLVVLGVPEPKHVRRPTFEILPGRSGAGFGGWVSRLGGRAARSRELVSSTTVISGLPANEVRIAPIAQALGIDVVRTGDPGLLRARARIYEARPEALVVAGFHRLLSKEVLALPERGGLNVHPGRLPAERGPSPVFWALKAGRTEIGWSVHLLDEGEDSGDLLATGELRFDPGTDGEQVHALAARAAAPALLRTLRGVLVGEVVRTPQAQEGRGRCPRPRFRDGLIDPQLPAEAVYTFVAGCARSYPLFVECGGDRFFVARAVSYDPEATLAFEYALTGDRLILGCAPGVVELELKPGGTLFAAEYGL